MVEVIFIQAQELKVNTETAMRQMDQILERNILTLKMTATIPAFGALYLIWIYIGKSSITNYATLTKLQILVIHLERTFREWHSADENDTDKRKVWSKDEWSKYERLKLQSRGRSQFLLTRIERYIEKLVCMDLYLYQYIRLNS